jgi:peptide/nickel transport system substrate-binding protein
MKNKNQISLIRKALYGVMLFGLFFSAFGAGNLPSARAQEAMTNVDLSPLTSGTTYPIDPHTFVRATISDAVTLDPALAYDTSSGEVIQNIYETLVFYDGAKASAFVPQLADSYNLSADGLTWTFHIRPGVTFHNGTSLTPTDVAYSFQRGLLQGGTSSPQWLLYEPFFGIGIDDISLLVDPGGSLYDNRVALSAWNPAELVATCQQVQAAVVADNVAGTVTIHLAQPWSPFLSTIAGTWGSIMNKDWTIAQGGWDGSCGTWQNWYALNASMDTLTEVANGTGPFKLDHWTRGEEIVLARNNSYWREPAQLENVVIQVVPDNDIRFAMLQTGNADQVDVSGGNHTLADGMTGEDCIWNIVTAQYDCSLVDAAKPLRRYIGRPRLSQDEVLLNFNIATGGNPYIGSGQLDGNGIPPDFFADAHIRKAFNYCFNWDTYIQQGFGGEFVQATTLALEGMPGYDLSAPHYTFNLSKCQEEFGLADVDHDGIPSAGDNNDVTQVGFHVQILYNQGNTSTLLN